MVAAVQSLRKDLLRDPNSDLTPALRAVVLPYGFAARRDRGPLAATLLQALSRLPQPAPHEYA
ncbi:MAG: hypothetical protein ACK50B_13900, partial [Betaproteobacteria bacterium]